MLLPFVPPSLVLSSVSPTIDAVTAFLVVFELSCVSYSIDVSIDSNAMHIVILPCAIEFPPVLPSVMSVPIDFIVFPLANIDTSVCKMVSAESLFLAL